MKEVETLKKELHPSIIEFKEFVKKHPKLIQEVRIGNKNWQEIYEDWYLLGETDDTWSKYRNEAEQKTSESSTNTDFVGKIFNSIKNVDINNVSQQISNVNQAITTIQSVMEQLQIFKKPTVQSRNHQANHPFSFRKD